MEQCESGIRYARRLALVHLIALHEAGYRGFTQVVVVVTTELVVEHAEPQRPSENAMRSSPNSLKIADMIARPPGSTGIRSGRNPCSFMRDASPACSSSPRSFSSPSRVRP
jgi:hypothetical protein